MDGKFLPNKTSPNNKRIDYIRYTLNPFHFIRQTPANKLLIHDSLFLQLAT